MRRAQRNREHGNTMILALIVLSALATLGTLTTVSVQSSFRASTNDRSQALALYAAESGAALIMDYLRHHFDPSPLPVTGVWNRPKAWSAFVRPPDQPPISLDGTEPTSGATPSSPNNPFREPSGTQIIAWYESKIFNNKDDTPSPYLIPNPAPPPAPPALAVPYVGPPALNGYYDGFDYDGRVIIQITGHGPQEATAILEVEVQWPIQQQLGVPPPTAVPAPPDKLPLTIIGWHVVNL